MRVLVLGAYGLIGREVAYRLQADGYEITGLGRNARAAASMSGVGFVRADLRHLTTPDAWMPHLRGIDGVVNAAGALQDGPADDLQAVHVDAIGALAAACEASGATRFVQISAAGASPDASTAFYRTKAAGDAGVLASALDWTILRPALVIAPTAYGGTALLRMLAGFPWVLPLVHADAPVQTVPVDEVAEAVSRALSGALIREDVALAEADPMTLEDTALAIREWLGFQPPRAIWRLPSWVGGALGLVADLAGMLGWRAPLRTTALKVMAEGVTADASQWAELTGRRVPALPETLSAIPSTAQERLFARAALVFPVLVAFLGAFWIASGLIAIATLDAAARVLAPGGGASAKSLVVVTALLDIAIGLAALTRRWVRPAAVAAIGVSLAYLVGATLFIPALWADPLGPLVKVFPAIGLAVAVWALAEER